MLKPTLAILGLLLLALPARAQIGGGPTSQTPYSGYAPRVSPYSSIVTGGNNPAVNYFNLTLPQFRLNNLTNQLTAPLNLNLPAPTPDSDEMFPSLPGTGHVVGFQYTNPYFNAVNSRTFFPYNPAAANQQRSLLNQRR